MHEVIWGSIELPKKIWCHFRHHELSYTASTSTDDPIQMVPGHLKWQQDPYVDWISSVIQVLYLVSIRCSKSSRVRSRMFDGFVVKSWEEWGWRRERDDRKEFKYSTLTFTMTVNSRIDLIESTEYNTEVITGKGLLISKTVNPPCFRKDNNFLLIYWLLLMIIKQCW